MTRLMRSAVLAVRDLDYVAAARALGAGDVRLMLRHVLPNALGAGHRLRRHPGRHRHRRRGRRSRSWASGLQLPAISWGLMIAGAQPRLLTAPHLLLFPGLFLSVTVLAFVLWATPCATPSTPGCDDRMTAPVPGGRGTSCGRVPPRRTDGVVRGQRASASTSPAARRWPSWASRARARASPPRPSWGILDAPPGRITGGADPLPAASTCWTPPNEDRRAGARQRHGDGLPGPADARSTRCSRSATRSASCSGVHRGAVAAGGPAPGGRAAGAGRHPGRRAAGRTTTRTSSPAGCASG